MAPRRKSRAARFYRRLLGLYPAEFRWAYGRELLLLFEDLWRDAPSRRERLRTGSAAFGGVLREAPKERRDVLIHDIRAAVRHLRKEPGTTLAVIALLALGMGSATLIFSFANGLFLRPLPYPNPDRLVAVDEYSPTDPHEFGEMSVPNYADIRAGTRELQDIGLFHSGDVTLRNDGPAEIVNAGVVTDGVLPLLGVAPLLGHLFTRQEDVTGGPRVAILGEALWRSRYGGDPNILNRTINTGNNVYRIVGVMPVGFNFPERAEVWFPMRADVATAPRTDYNSSAIGRLKPGVTIEAATAEVEGLLTGIHQAHPEADNGWRARVRALRAALTTDYRTPVTMLFVAAGLLLLIACMNVSHLLLAKASHRVREMAIRRALGASQSRLVCQLIVESVILAVIGGGLGVGLTYLGVPALLKVIPDDLPAWMNFAVDARVLAFAGAVSLATSLIFGVAPSLGVARGDLTTTLRDSGRAGTGGTAQRAWRDSLVVAEVALSVLLLVGAGLTFRSMIAILSQPLGYEPAHVLSLAFDYPEKRYAAGAPARAMLREVASRLSGMPGVVSVAFGSGIPLQSDWTRIFTIEGRPVPLEQMPFANHVVVAPGYFRTLGIPVLRGRDFDDNDYQTKTAMIADAAFAAKYWPGEDPLGKRVRFGPPSANDVWHQIVGIVGDSRYGHMTGQENSTIYLPYGAYDGNVVPTNVIIRTTGDPSTVARVAANRITAFDATIAVSDVRTLGEVIERAVWEDRLVAWLTGGFALTALALAAAGLYGVLAYTVSLQTREIGIRIALGAAPPRMRRLLLRRGLTLTVAGLVVGIVLAVGLVRFLASFLYLVSPTDAVTFGAVSAVLVVVGLLASAWPAHQATRVDPLVALRQD